MTRVFSKVMWCRWIYNMSECGKVYLVKIFKKIVSKGIIVHCVLFFHFTTVFSSVTCCRWLNKSVCIWERVKTCIICVHNIHIMWFIIFSDCTLPMVIQLPNITDLTDVSCHIGSSCLDVNCCVYVDKIQTYFDFYFNQRPCELILEIGIENMQYEVLYSSLRNGKVFCI